MHEGKAAAVQLDGGSFGVTGERPTGLHVVRHTLQPMGFLK